MWLQKYRKKLLVFLLLIAFLGFCYFLSVFYWMTNGFRNYEKFCSGYIPLIETYKTRQGTYPKTIADFEKPAFSWRYDSAACNYVGNPDNFSFQISDGFIGIGIYLSEEKRWVYD